MLAEVDKCMASLEELQYTVKGRGRGMSSGVGLSPRRTNHRCKQESLRIRNATSNKSPQGKLPINAERKNENGDGWLGGGDELECSCADAKWRRWLRPGDDGGAPWGRPQRADVKTAATAATGRR
ncbi:unnamed protein product [Cuscuta epithymum]|uniref:Uncharacterized protein n=1 Tax=Cuscuta epithymum TaxID=186058 RepID=A0AAV0D4P3_9ASTE|nr:unnamed protein product [Cuscuta epithymum]